MDWQFKHFNQQAVFGAARDRVLEVARAVMLESFGPVEDTPDGLVAHGRSAGHALTATIRVGPAPAGTQVTAELRVARAGWRSFMLIDIGGYFDAQLRRWLSAVGQRLGQPPLSRSQPVLQQGCLAGCVVYVVLGAGLAVLAIPLDHFVFRLPANALPGPAMITASFIGLFAGVLVFLYLRHPDAALWHFLHRQPRP